MKTDLDIYREIFFEKCYFDNDVFCVIVSVSEGDKKFQVKFEEVKLFLVTEEAFDSAFFFEPFLNDEGFLKVIEQESSPLENIFTVHFMCPDAGMLHFRLVCSSKNVHVVTRKFPVVEKYKIR